jgi:predicted Zn-dependent protease
MAEWFATRKLRDEAERLYALAVLTAGRAERYWRYRAELERSCGDLNDVESLLSRGLERHPDDVPLLREMAAELDRRDRPDEAIERLERAVTLEPTWPDLRFELARLYDRAEHPQRSLAQFRKALDLNPGYERAALSQAELLLKLGETEGAAVELETLRERGVEPQQVYRLLSLIYAESEDPRQAARFGALAQEEGPA